MCLHMLKVNVMGICGLIFREPFYPTFGMGAAIFYRPTLPGTID